MSGWESGCTKGELAEPPVWMGLRADDFDYHLPEELIASRPLEDRAGARMLVVNRGEGSISHRMFRDFPMYVTAGDVCVLNDSRVVPSRLFTNDGKVELLRVAEPEPLVWHSLVKPGKRARVGARLEVADSRGVVEAVIEEGMRRIRWDTPIDLDRHAELALPPYMHRHEESADQIRYQTVYAANAGSIAAPTAGLHFTPDILAGLPHDFLTLHVGIGTFRPVKAELVDDHVMHEEWFDLPASTVNTIAAAKRVVAIGTTTTRVLESVARDGMPLRAGAGRTSIFIRPPYDFRCVGALLTNFHLPKSTLLMLVSAFAGCGLIREAYQQAVAERYRFFSYGDCMLIL